MEEITFQFLMSGMIYQLFTYFQLIMRFQIFISHNFLSNAIQCHFQVIIHTAVSTMLALIWSIQLVSTLLGCRF